MSKSRELFGVAANGIASRKVRTLLILLGPVVGVAAMVGAVGLTESAKGDLKEKLSSLGTNLITVQAAGTLRPAEPHPPQGRGDAGEGRSDGGAGVGGERDRRRGDPAQRGLVGLLPGVPGAGARRRRHPPDRARGAVAQRSLARSERPEHQVARGRHRIAGSPTSTACVPGEIRTITLNGIDYGVVGVLDPVALDPNLDNAAFITQYSAKHDFATEGAPTKMYVRAAPGTTQETSDALPTAISLGSTDAVTTKIPSDALEAASKADKTLQQTALFAGILALAVGGLGIANVMSISVIQRSSEIGIRRAIGTTRSLIALQFLLEALFVGILGGILGAMLGVGVVYLVSGFAGWVVVVDYGRMPLWIGLAVAVSVIAGLYPSVKAARLEPLETLRLG